MADAPITWPAFLTEMSASEGDTGLNVYVLQSRLAQMGCFTGSRTACFGDLTREAVQRFQQEMGLEVTGQADAATWAAIYSRSYAADTSGDAMKPGDSGDDVKAVQTRLNALGFFDNALSGEYGYATETSVRLFQTAAGLEATGILDADSSSRLMADDAPSMLDGGVQQRFAAMLSEADTTVQTRLFDIARAHIGAFFEGEEDDLYPGFSFVQYVCVAAGLPVTIPEDLIGMASQQVQSMDSVGAGSIVVFQSNGENVVNMVMAIGIGDSMVIGTNESSGWAEPSYMEQMDGATIYCWNGK
jgi:peptidoglycan hydrolase-like protein with peptidoglycan-binding domain